MYPSTSPSLKYIVRRTVITDGAYAVSSEKLVFHLIIIKKVI